MKLCCFSWSCCCSSASHQEEAEAIELQEQPDLAEIAIQVFTYANMVNVCVQKIENTMPSNPNVHFSDGFIMVGKNFEYMAGYDTSTGFIDFTCGDLPKNEANVGWKLHIGLQPTEANLTRGWDIVKNLFIEYKIKSAKIRLPTGERYQPGKEITIYAHYNDISQGNMEFWRTFCNRLEDELTKADVIPHEMTQELETWQELQQAGESSSRQIGRTRTADVRIEGSHYITYRNDRAIKDIDPIDNLNKSAIYSKSFNRTGEPVIFMDLAVQRPRMNLTP